MAIINLPYNYKLEDNKIYYNVDSTWVTVGVLHDQIISATLNSQGNLEIEFDSALDPIGDAIAPIILPKLKDIDDNPITWSISENIITNDQNILDIKQLTSTSSYLLFPNTDYKTGVRTGSFEEVIMKAQVNGGLPSNNYDSNQDYLNYINSVDISLKYTPFSLMIDTINIPQARDYLDIGLTAITLERSVNLGINNLEGVYIVPDGTKMVVLSSSGIVYSYDLEDEFDIQTAINRKSYTIYSQLASTYTGFSFNYDGTKMYVFADYSKIIQFNLSTPYDITTLELQENYFADTNINAKGLVTEDGKYDFSFSRQGTMVAKEFETNFEANTLSQTRITKTFSPYAVTYTFIGYPTYTDFINGARVIRVGYNGNQYDYRTIFEHYGYFNTFTFSEDGVYLYTVTDIAVFDGKIERYKLSTPWQINSNVLEKQTILHTFGQTTTEKVEKNYKDNGISDLKFSADGTKMFILDRLTAAIYQFNLPEAWSLYSLNLTVIKPISKLVDNTGYDFKYNLTQIPNPTPTDPFLAENEINSLRFSENGFAFYIMNDKGFYKYTLVNQYSLDGGVLYVGYYPADEQILADAKSFDIFDSNTALFLHKPGILEQFILDSNPSTLDYKYTNKIKNFDNIIDLFIDEDSAGGATFTILNSPVSDGVYYVTTGKLDSTQEISNLDINLTPYDLDSNYVKTVAKSDITNKFFLGKDKMLYEYDYADSSNIDPLTFELTGSISDIRGFTWKKDGTLFYVCGNGRVESYKTKNVFRTKLIN